MGYFIYTSIPNRKIKKLDPNSQDRTEFSIPTEAFKNLGSLGYLLLRKTIQKYWHDAEYNPEAFTKLGLCILLKIRDLSNSNKWRDIALGDIAAKLISSIIATRLTKHIATFGMDEQWVHYSEKDVQTLHLH